MKKLSVRRTACGVGAVPMRIRSALVVCVTVLLGACGSGTGDSDSALSDAAAQTRARYQILDLASGQVTATGAVEEIATRTEYRTTKMVFRLVEVAGGTIGTAANGLGAALDPSASSVSVPSFYLAVFETTQAQWQLLAGTSPWLQLASVDGSDDVRIGDNLPATGISHDLATTAVATYQVAVGVSLSLPSDVQWEVACRAGGTSTWSWGDSATAATVNAAAVVWETASGIRGARPVGQRSASALGFFDLHGNVGEQTVEEHVRGGSWNDSLATARAAHRGSIDPATRHLLVGVRLVYVP